MDQDVGHVTPEAVPTKPGAGLGKDGLLYLPNPHPLVDSPTEGSWGHKVNSAWRSLNYFFRGIYGTAVEWCVSWMDLALEYPRVAAIFALLAAVLIEETFATNPVLHGTLKYVMFSVDPDAAEVIFPPEVDPEEASEIVDKVAAGVLKSSAEEYYRSPEFKQLELDLRAQMHREVLESVTKMSGIEIPPPPPPEEEKGRKRGKGSKDKAPEPTPESPAPAEPTPEAPGEQSPP